MLTAILLLCSLLSVQAQIPAEVTDMMRKCKDNMTHASGIEMDTKIHGDDERLEVAHEDFYEEAGQ